MLLKSITRSLFFGSVFLSLLNLPVIAQVPTISYPNGTNLRHYYIGTAISSETPTVGGGGLPSQTYVHSIVEEFYSTRNSATLPLTVPHPNTVFPLDYGQFAFASQNSQVYSIDWTLQSAVGTAVNGSLNTIFGFIRMSVLGTPKYVYSDPTTHRIYLSGVGVVGGNPTQVVSGTNNGSAAAGDYALFNSPMAIVPVPNLANKIYVADKGNNKIRILDLTTSTASDFTITGVTLNAPVGLAVDSGSNLWVTDSHRLIKITPQGQATVMAGNGTAGDVDGNASVSRLNTPYGISIDGSDDVYFADRMNHKIKVYHPANGILSTMAGSTQGNQLGLNGAAKFDEPSAVWVSGDGTLMHVADYNNNKIKSIRMTKAFGISPALPPGLTMDVFSGQISGTPTINYTQRNFTVSVTNPSGIGTIVFPMVVTAVPPSNLTYASPTNIYTVGTTISPNQPSNQGHSITGYTVYPQLPPGLSLNATTGVISGTPTEGTVQTDYVITGSNTGGSTTATVTMYVQGPPYNMGYSRAQAVLVQNEPAYLQALPMSYPAASSYALNASSPALPTGLSLNTSTGEITGTPTNLTANAVYTIDVTNPFGTASGTVEIQIQAKPTINYVPPGSPYLQGQAITPLTPTLGGGSINANLGGWSNTGIQFGGNIAFVQYGSSPLIRWVLDAGQPLIKHVNGNSFPVSLAGGGPSYLIMDPQYFFYNVSNEVGNTRITKVPSSDPNRIVKQWGGGTIGYLDGVGHLAQFNQIGQIATDAIGSRIYVPDRGNKRIRVINVPNNTVSTIAGSGSSGTSNGIGAAASFTDPVAATLGVDNYLYVLDQISSGVAKLRKINLTTNEVSDFINLDFTPSNYLVTDKGGDMYLTGGDQSGLRRITRDGLVILLPNSEPLKSLAISPENGDVIIGPVSGASYSSSFTNKGYFFTPGESITISPSLFAGLSFDATNGTITGTPTGVGLNTTNNIQTYTVRATNRAGIFTTNVTLSVVRPPSGLSYQFNPWNILVGDASLSNTRNNANISTGGLPAETYAVSPALPAGLSLNPNTGQITGSALNLLNSTAYTITASNAYGSTSAVLYISVQDKPRPAYQGPQVYLKNNAITTLTPTNTGGAVLSPARIELSNLLTLVDSNPNNGFDIDDITKDGNGNFYIGYTLRDISWVNPEQFYIAKIDANGAILKTQNISSKAVKLTFWNNKIYYIGRSYMDQYVMEMDVSTNTWSPQATSIQHPGWVLQEEALKMLAHNNLLYISNRSVGLAVFNLTTQNPENMFTDYLNSNAPSNIYRGVWDAVNGTHYDQNYNTLPGGYVTAYTEQFDILSSGNLVQIVNNTLTYQSEVKTLAYNATSHDYDVLSTSTPSLPNQIKTLNATSSGAIIISEGAGFYKIENGVISVYSGDYQNGSFNSAVQTGTIPMSQGQAGPISYNDVETSILDADGNIILTDKSPFSYWTQTNLLQKYAERVAYRISPALPNGLQLDPANGEISGTPTVTSVATNYTITAYNSVGSRSTSLNITVGAPIDFTYQRNGNTGLANAPWSGSVTNPLFSGSNFASTGSQGITLDISESTDRYGIYSPSGVTFSISPALPTGLSFNTSTGQITGTPTVARNLSTYTVTAVNAYGTSTATLQFAITGVATLSYGGNQTFIQGIVGSATPQVGGISGTITYTATGLPTGVTLSPSGTLLYDGQGAAVSATSVSITATGSTSGTATATFTVTILPPGSAPSNLVYGGPYSLSTAGSIPAITPSITAGTGSVTYSISPNLTSLTGLSINPSTGVISGTPNTAMLATTFTVTASSAYGSTSSTFSLALGAPPAAITYPASAYQFWQNEAISNIVVSGGSGASSFSATQLPAGLQIDPVSGTIYGLPTQIQSATLATVSATNSFGSATYGITFTVVAPPSISYTTPHDLIVSTAASISPSITGGLSNTITLSPSLPAGLSINAAGVISGTPSTTSVATTYTATLTSTVNGTTKTANASTVIRVGVGPSALTYSSPVLLRQNAGMSQLSPSITAGSGILTYTATGLPVGVLIDPATGILYGTPTTLQSASNATITATSTFGSTSTTVSLAVGAAPSALSYPASTYQFTNGASIGSLTPSITSGTGSTTYSISPGLPTGLVFNTTTGVISGTTNVVSNTIYTITASNSYGSTTYPLQITTGVAPAFTYVSPQVYTAGTSISALAPVLTAGTGNINYTISPALPTGLAIDPLNGTITGTPSTGIAVAASTYTVTATNAFGSGTANISIQVLGPPTNLSYGGNLAYPINIALSGSGSVPTISSNPAATFSINQALPAGLSFNTSTGAITGTPTVATAPTSYTVTATNGIAPDATVTFTIAVTAFPIISYTTPQNLPVGQAANIVVTAYNSPTSYSVSPALPTGLSLNTTSGLISGTPSSVQSLSTYTVTATNVFGSGTTTVDISIGNPPSAYSYSSNSLVLGTGSAMSALSATVTSGSSAVTYSVSPSLPAGLTLNTSTGVISGTPTSPVAQQSYTFTASNAFGSTTTTVSITTGTPPSNLLVSGSIVATAGASLSPVTPSVTAGTGTLTYSVGPALPTGLTLNTSTGVISGTPSTGIAVANTNYTLTATSAFGSTSTSFALQVQGPPSNLSYGGNMSFSVNAAISPQIPTVNANPSPSFSISPGLPAGLSFNTSTGAITGTPTSAQAATSYQVTANNGISPSATTTFTITILAAPVISYVQPTVYLVGTNITPLTPTVSGNVVTWSISPSSLPAGLSFNNSNGQITGNPTAVFASQNFTVTATNQHGSGTSMFQLAVHSIPTGLSYGGVVQAILGIPTNGSGFVPTLVASPSPTFSISPGLPPGLSFNTSTGAITGTATSLLSLSTFTVTATNSVGSASFPIQLQVVPNDTDGDGVTDAQELLDGTNPNDGCSYLAASQVLANTSPSWQNADCDGDGNANGTDSAPRDFCIDGTGQVPANGTPAYDIFRYQDCDGDGILNGLECSLGVNCPDFDNDGIPNYLDTDSDNDQIGDITEGNIDTDGDGSANYIDLDSDNDGILDIRETTQDRDGDGTPNYLDLDSDGDGILDTVEATADYRAVEDSNGDGICDRGGVTSDANYNGIPDQLEPAFGGRMLEVPDTDKDGTPDFLDLDADGDGILDSIELTGDMDADQHPNYRDGDSDGDGISDSVEKFGDMDGDGKPNFLDLDSDGDGISDQYEGLNLCFDCGRVDNNDDGYDDRAQQDSKYPAVDTDKDGAPDFLDLDSDNDGIPDAVEAGNDPTNPVDTDQDGTPDFRDIDSDNDGIPDSIEAGKDPAVPVDTDNDGTPDFRDLDSDNDGITDAIEAGADPTKPLDTDGDGIYDFRDIDSDNDGISDNIEKGPTATPVDTDKDGLPDYRDIDSDNDGISDNIEKGPTATPVDTDGDGAPDFRDLDSDNDGISDNIEKGPTATPIDTDGDGIYDFRDLDSDNDGISDNIEKGPTATPVDTDGDGLPDYRDLDSDNDGISDNIEKGPTATPVDTDGDGLPDYRDLDSDSDTLSDNIEKGPTATPVDTDKDGNADFRDLDSDNDGITDKIEAGPDAKNPLDTDKDLTYDFRDIDSDNDGILDKDEDDLNMGAIPDCDQDGIPNRLDSDVCKGFAPNGISPNGDGKNDVLIIPGIMQVQPNRLSVFNRWGSLVFEKENYQNDWNGANLPDGTYYYIVDYFGKKVALKNYLYINRLGK